MEKEKKQKLKDEQEKLSQEAKNEKEKRREKNLTAFDVLMQAQQTHYNLENTTESFIPASCTPGPWASEFGQRINIERRMSFGSSPNLLNRLKKRGSEQLSSPNSPDHVSDTMKKSRAEGVGSPISN